MSLFYIDVSHCFIFAFMARDLFGVNVSLSHLLIKCLDQPVAAMRCLRCSFLVGAGWSRPIGHWQADGFAASRQCRLLKGRVSWSQYTQKSFHQKSFIYSLRLIFQAHRIRMRPLKLFEMPLAAVCCEAIAILPQVTLPEASFFFFFSKEQN